MKENISILTAVLAIIIALGAVVSSLVITPDLSINAGSIGENELLDNAVTSQKIKDNTITDKDIDSNGITRITENSISSTHIFDGTIILADLSSEVLASMSGVVEILNNSITSDKIADGTITNADIIELADIDPSKISGTAWTAINDGSGSNLDADTIDGIQSNQFLRNDESVILNGDLTVTGNITHQTVTRYYNIPFCAFSGRDSDVPYSYEGDVLRNSDPAFAGHYYDAPVILPDGAELSKIIIRYHTADSACSAHLYLYERGDLITTELTFIDLPRYIYIHDYESDISGTISAYNKTYWVSIWLDPNDSRYDLEVVYVYIEYTVTKPYP